tara:strand:+ start:635 stop:943 length:309 start_codon:yes stop_codon:yes gene_type:complete
VPAILRNYLPQKTLGARPTSRVDLARLKPLLLLLLPLLHLILGTGTLLTFGCSNVFLVKVAQVVSVVVFASEGVLGEMASVKARIVTAEEFVSKFRWSMDVL